MILIIYIFDSSKIMVLFISFTLINFVKYELPWIILKNSDIITQFKIFK